MPVTTRSRARVTYREEDEQCDQARPVSQEQQAQPAQLSLEDDAKYAAIIDFCDHLSQLRKQDTSGTKAAGLRSIFFELLRTHPRSPSRPTHERLQLLWSVLGRGFIRAQETCRRILHGIDEKTLKASLRDKADLRELRAQLIVMVCAEVQNDRTKSRISRLERQIVGKQKMIIAEAKKVDLLHRLFYQQKQTQLTALGQKQRRSDPGVIARAGKLILTSGRKQPQGPSRIITRLGKLILKSGWKHQPGGSRIIAQAGNLILTSRM